MSEAVADTTAQPGDPTRVNALHCTTSLSNSNSVSNQTLPDPNVPPQNGCCLLLALPRELRDAIYEYALTEDQGLCTYRHEDYGEYDTGVILEEPSGSQIIRFWPTEGTASRQAYNQLKYCCWQLHHETVGLELSLNHLTFGTINKYGQDHLNSGFRYLEDFLYVCSLRNQALIKSIAVSTSGAIRSDRTVQPLFSELFGSSVIEFCRSHPSCKVVIYLDGFRLDSSPEDCMFLAAVIKTLVGKSTVLRLLNMTGIVCPDLEECAKKMGGCLPSNVILAPSTLFKLEAAPLNYFDGSPDDLVQLFKQLARLWCYLGF